MNYLDWFWLKNKNLLRRNCLYKFHIFWRYRKVSKWVSILRYRYMRLVSKLRYRKVSIFKMGIMVRYRYLISIKNRYRKRIDTWKRYRYPTLVYSVVFANNAQWVKTDKCTFHVWLFFKTYLDTSQRPGIGISFERQGFQLLIKIWEF